MFIEYHYILYYKYSYLYKYIFPCVWRVAEWRNRFFCRVGPSGGRGTVSGCVPGPMTSSKMDAVKPDPLAEGAGRVGGGRAAGWWRSEIKCGICSFFFLLFVFQRLCVCARLWLFWLGKFGTFIFQEFSVFLKIFSAIFVIFLKN